MRSLSWLVGALVLLSVQSAWSEPYYPYNAVDFLVPVDELDAGAVEEAAVHSGFRPILDSNPKVAALRAAPDPLYAMWELPSHKLATITLTKMSKTNSFVVMFVSKEPGKRELIADRRRLQEMAVVFGSDAHRVRERAAENPFPPPTMHALA